MLTKHAAALISSTEAFVVPVRLVTKGDSVRRLQEKYLPPAVTASFDHEPQTAFADGFPFLILSEASLEDLNQRMPSDGPPASERNFRPNILLRGCQAFEVRRHA